MALRCCSSITRGPAATFRWRYLNRVDVAPERAHLRLLRVAQVGQPEQVLDTAQQRVVVVGHLADRARPDELRQQHGADPAAARPVQARLVDVRVRRVVEAQAVLLAAARGRVRVIARLVEGDHDEPARPVGRGMHDPRDPRLEEPVGLRQPALLAVLAARGVMGVGAGVRRDVGVVGRGRQALQAARQRPQVDHVRVAVGLVVDDRVEVHERVVARGVAVVGRAGGVGEVNLVQRRVPARRAVRGPGGAVAVRVDAHVLLVGPPGQVMSGELIGDRAHVPRVDAAVAGQLAVLGPLVEVLAAELDELLEELAVLAGLVVRRLAGDLRDVVVQAVVADAVVVAQQRALRRQRPGQVGRLLVPGLAERVAERLVLQVDDPDVPDRRSGGPRRAVSGGPGRRGTARAVRAVRRRRGHPGPDGDDDRDPRGRRRQPAAGKQSLEHEPLLNSRSGSPVATRVTRASAEQ
jgi:hypothetical protein